MEIECPWCRVVDAVPCTYGEDFICRTCGNVVETEYDESYSEEVGETMWWWPSPWQSP